MSSHTNHEEILVSNKANSSTIILGIDPGSCITGFGLLQITNRQCRYLASGCIRVKPGDTADRLQQIFLNLEEVIKQYQPTTAAIEQIFMHQNPGSALKLGQARGVAIVALANHNLNVSEYSARQVKQAVVGYGAADKHQVQQMVKSILNLTATPQADAADALAIALCHYHSQQSLVKLAGANRTVRGRLR